MIGGAVRLFTRAIRPPPDDVTPNPNDPVTAFPGTVGPPTATPGDPHGVVVTGEPGQFFPPRIIPSAWSGWPSDWWPPLWGSGGMASNLTDIAWLCVDMNASLLSTMPPYLVNAAPTLDADWLRNPDPNIYSSWDEFAKQLFWDYQAAGEAFVVATARYATGWPARFNVVPPWFVNVEMDAGRRVYTIGSRDVTDDMLHVRYQSTVSDAHGHGPLEAGQYRMVAAQMLMQYGAKLAGGLIPPGVLTHPEELSRSQAAALQAQWVEARISSLGEPAVLSGGITFEATQISPKDMALVDLTRDQESRIACLLGVPPALVGLPSGGDPMTYSNVTMYFTQHWRVGLRPKAQQVMDALSGFLLPRQTRVELNRDAYIEPEPLVRAQTDQILAGIADPATGQQAKTVAEIRASERLDDTTPTGSGGVLR